ncbi:siphovirus ReqiPepy6 Gp37-like family protein [Paenibacillus alvei]|nr:siphovirus ReqiPepy6 Gp37-like family protein [Paenibacillus alvei]EJW17558.1 hypothetical protein PAV_3c00030 [Paenibacillus alvei DSM 29]MCY9539180.1 siphovirus ReqiPepy6 Gp37-like family protein [Paenibacillus alvei]MCY9707415.1 siphovirus ReqiPepy6 Gp37-like family protein [Paenibacillus alvei]MEC0084103.1 siphovirus ReqiPepy6 Gp37-like family protein [Paenibacillus alvei]
MQAIRIIDTSFNLLGEIDNYESLQFIRRFFGTGEFELHISVGKQYADTLQKGNVIMLVGHAHKSGIITSRQITLGEDGTQTVVAKGTTLEGVLDRRVTVTQDYDRVRGAAETVIKHYVNQHISNASDPDRKIPYFICAPDQKRGKETPWQSRFEPLHEVVEKIAKFCDIGYYAYVDIPSRKWVFDVMTGRDLTTGQKVNPPVIFSTQFNNVQSQEFVEADSSYKNVGYAGGKGEEEERLIQVVGNVSGLERREVFMDCSSAEDAVELSEMGAQKLAEYGQIITFDGRVLDTRSFQYEHDWDLGDIVTLRDDEWGVELNSRITEVREIYEQDSKIEIQFGDEIPTVTKAVKSMQNQIDRLQTNSGLAEVVKRLDSGVLLRDNYFNIATIHTIRSGVEVQEFWLLINARYDHATKRFKRINLDNFSFGWQMQANGTYPGEENIGDFVNQGMNLWKANGKKAYAVGDPAREQTGEDIGAYQPDGSWREFGIMLGWNNHFMCDAYGGMTIGGAGFEIDGAGTSPFCRLSLGKFSGGSSVPNRPVQDYMFTYNGTCWNTQHGLWNKDVDDISGFFYGLKAPVNFYDTPDGSFNPWSNRADMDKAEFVVMKLPGGKSHHVENWEHLVQITSSGKAKIHGHDVPISSAITVELNESNAANVFYPSGWTKDNTFITSIKGIAADGAMKPVNNYDATYLDYGVYLGMPAGYKKAVVLLSKAG